MRRSASGALLPSGSKGDPDPEFTESVGPRSSGAHGILGVRRILGPVDTNAHAEMNVANCGSMNADVRELPRLREFGDNSLKAPA